MTIETIDSHIDVPRARARARTHTIRRYGNHLSRLSWGDLGSGEAGMCGLSLGSSRRLGSSANRSFSQRARRTKCRRAVTGCDLRSVYPKVRANPMFGNDTEAPCYRLATVTAARHEGLLPGSMSDTDARR